MIILKLLLIPILVLLLAQAWSEFKNSRLGIFWFLLWLIVWTSVGIIVFFPSLTTSLANLLGIERGIDSVIYLSIVALFYLIFRIYLKIENLNRKISSLVQKLTLGNNEKE